ncbi:MAG TPA: D-ornithine 4,5-aminomutase subunit OraS [Propionibacteriaceae bacterium]|nr:D-ornithine 4,5-aminomutase subunit OraS [Propionibacteriaceae bacterium]
MTERLDAYEARRATLAGLSDDELKARFWSLSHQIMAPVADLARTHTSPSIERSILLRMGVDSLSTHAVVDRIADAGLLGKGASHVVAKLAHERGIGVREAAALLVDDPGVLVGLFGGAR